VRYSTWVAAVFHALERATQSVYGGVGLAAVALEVGVDEPTWDDFAKREGLPRALMTAMEDLEAIGLVEFANVSHGNKLTPEGRDLAAAGLRSLWPAISGIPVTDIERSFLARLYEASLVTDERWADLHFADADPIYRDLGLESAESYPTTIQRLTFLGDLERKGLIKPESSALGSANNYRPRYTAAVLAAEPDARDHGMEAGLIDWSIPTPGFEAIEERLAELKVRLADARSDDDFSDIGRRCRDIAADAMDAVFRVEMVPEGEEAPSRQDANGRLRLYLAAVATGDPFDELRSFLKAALRLAQARTHSARTGQAAAVAAAQGLLSFVRALEAIERSASVRDSRE
jgi:hypothetical protein